MTATVRSSTFERVQSGDFEAILTLIRSATLPIEADADGCTLLHHACERVYPVVVSELLATGLATGSSGAIHRCAVRLDRCIVVNANP